MKKRKEQQGVKILNYIHLDFPIRFQPCSSHYPALPDVPQRFGNDSPDCKFNSSFGEPRAELSILPAVGMLVAWMMKHAFWLDNLKHGL